MLYNNESNGILLTAFKPCNAVVKEFNRAIDYAIDDGRTEGLTFLAMWREGDWDGIRKEFPDFDVSTISQPIPKVSPYNPFMGYGKYGKIKEGEVLIHPNGDTFTVVFDNAFSTPWRAVYDNGDNLALFAQVGPKGQAVRISLAQRAAGRVDEK